MSKKSLKRILIILFGSAFVGSTVFMLIGSLLPRQQHSAPIADSSTNAEEVPEVNYQDNARSRLQAELIGYEKLLAKEPENTTVLNNLVRLRLTIGDLEGAVTDLNKLIKLQPERTELVAALQDIEAELAKQKTEK